MGEFRACVGSRATLSLIVGAPFRGVAPYVVAGGADRLPAAGWARVASSDGAAWGSDQKIRGSTMLSPLEMQSVFTSSHELSGQQLAPPPVLAS